MVVQLVQEYGPKRWSLIASNLQGRIGTPRLLIAHTHALTRTLTKNSCTHKPNTTPRPQQTHLYVCTCMGKCIVHIHIYVCMHVHTNTTNAQTGKQCRERWHNHLNPHIRKCPWTKEEDSVIVQAHERLGNRWAEIAKLVCVCMCVCVYVCYVYVCVCVCVCVFVCMFVHVFVCMCEW